MSRLSTPFRSFFGTSTWLWLLVCLQLLIPSAYYLRSSDPEDERFAWRMFSSVRLRRCEVRAYEMTAGARRPVALNRVLHASWIGAMRRGRRAVIDKFLHRHCAHNPVETVLVSRQCIEVDGRRLPRADYALACPKTDLTEEL